MVLGAAADAVVAVVATNAHLILLLLLINPLGVGVFASAKLQDVVVVAAVVTVAAAAVVAHLLLSLSFARASKTVIIGLGASLRRHRRRIRFDIQRCAFLKALFSRKKPKFLCTSISPILVLTVLFSSFKYGDFDAKPICHLFHLLASFRRVCTHIVFRP